MDAPERISNEKTVHFIIFTLRRVNQSIKETFFKDFKKIFLQCEKWCIIVFMNFTKQVLSKRLTD